MISHMKRHRKPARHRGDRLQCAGFCTILIAALLADGLFSSEPLVVGALVLLALTVLGGGLIYAGNYIKFYSQVALERGAT